MTSAPGLRRKLEILLTPQSLYYMLHKDQARRIKMVKKPIPVKEDKHPFKVGKQYRNRDGDFQVISINEPNMVIRYLDGRTVESSIVLQARIWENIQGGDDSNDFELEIA
jgi:hypothetical protein